MESGINKAKVCLISYPESLAHYALKQKFHNACPLQIYAAVLGHCGEDAKCICIATTEMSVTQKLDIVLYGRIVKHTKI